MKVDAADFRPMIDQAIAETLAERGIKQKELAQDAGISFSYLSRVRRGLSWLSEEKLIALCAVMGQPHEPFVRALEISKAREKGKTPRPAWAAMEPTAIEEFNDSSVSITQHSLDVSQTRVIRPIKRSLKRYPWRSVLLGAEDQTGPVIMSTFGAEVSISQRGAICEYEARFASPIRPKQSHEFMVQTATDDSSQLVYTIDVSEAPILHAIIRLKFDTSAGTPQVQIIDGETGLSAAVWDRHRAALDLNEFGEVTIEFQDLILGRLYGARWRWPQLSALI